MMDKNGSHFWNQRKKSDSITHIFEKSSEKHFQNAEWCNKALGEDSINVEPFKYSCQSFLIRFLNFLN
jgi:hypothetical protein